MEPTLLTQGNAILQAGAQRVSFGHAVRDRRQHLPRLFFERALWRKHAHCERFVLHLQFQSLKTDSLGPNWVHPYVGHSSRSKCMYHTRPRGNMLLALEPCFSDLDMLREERLCGAFPVEAPSHLFEP